MKLLAEQAKQDNLTARELEALNARINDLAAQVRALDTESRRTEDGRILEWVLMAGEIAIGALLLWGLFLFCRANRAQFTPY